MPACALVLINSIVVLISPDSIFPVITGHYSNGLSVSQREREGDLADGVLYSGLSSRSPVAGYNNTVIQFTGTAASCSAVAKLWS